MTQTLLHMRDGGGAVASVTTPTSSVSVTHGVDVIDVNAVKGTGRGQKSVDTLSPGSGTTTADVMFWF